MKSFHLILVLSMLQTFLRDITKAACKWAQQLQQVWDLQCIVGRIQHISLCNPCVMSVRGPNIVVLRFGDHRTKEMLGVVDWTVWPVSNLAQQYPTTCNRVCKQMQLVTSNNVASVCTGLKISSYWVDTTSRQGMKQLGISFSAMFRLFSYESSQGPHS